MNCFLRSIFLIILFFGIPNLAHTQTATVEISKNKVVVSGQAYLLHVVKEKQTLFSISKAYGVSLPVIMSANSKTVATVNVNEVLRIPVVERKALTAPILVEKEDNQFIYHIVKKGDTLFALYKKYGVSVEDIKKANPGSEQGLALNTVVKIPKLLQQKKQEISNVPQHDKKYYYYVIKPGDTQYSIAKEFFMKQRKLRKLNPHIKRKPLKIGDWVKIPRYLVPPEYFEIKEIPKDTIEEEFVVTDSIQKKIVEGIVQKNIRIGLFLPLYLETNDTINQIVTYKDSTEIVTAREPRIIYRKSREFLRFYQGVLLAVDSLKNEGISVDLHVFDTERNPETLRKILAKIQFTQFDFWIGPVYPRTFALATDFAKRKNIPIISPLSTKNPQINSNPNVIQLNTSLASVCKQIAEYICTDSEYKNIVVVHPDRYKHLNEFKLVQDIEHCLFEKGQYLQTEHVSYKKLSFDEFGLYGMAATMCDSCENIVVIPSNDQPLVENIITNLNVLSQRFAIRLVGFSKWQRYNSLESELFYNLNFSLFSPYYINYKDKKVDKFVTLFRNRFGCEPSDFSFRGYDLCRFFTLTTSRFSKDFPERINELEVDLLQSSYHFKSVSAFGGLENRGLHLINYSRDFKIRHKRIEQIEPEEPVDLLQKSFEY